MTEAIIVALITATATIIANVIMTVANRRKDAVERARAEQKTEDRLAAIEHKIDIHNGYADKLGEISRSMAVLATEIKNIKEER